MPQALHAQAGLRAESPAPWPSTVVLMSFGEILVGADSSRGVYVLAHQANARGLTPIDKAAGARYDPVAILNWLPSADSVVHAPRPARSDKRPSIQTLILHDTRGGGLLVGRFREGGEWSRWVFHFRDAAAWRVSLRADDVRAAEAVLEALRRAALASRLSLADSTPNACSKARWDDSTGVAWDPPRLKAMATPLYPAGLPTAPARAVVVLQYLVGPDGRVDPGTIDVLFASGPAFVRPFRDAIAGAAFLPGRARRAFIPVCLTHAFGFEAAP